MCGVFGFCGNEGQKFKMETMQKIARVTERRGPHAFGFAWIDARDRLHAFKRTGRISDHISLLEMASDAKMLIGHTRYATAGDPAVNINNHPHPCDGGWMVHNGQVFNYEDLLIEKDLHPSSDCDSEAIALMIEQADGSKTERCISAVNSVASSALVILAMWARPNKIVAVRRGNPLHVAESPRGLYLASLSEGLPGVVRSLADNHALTLSNEKGEARGKIRPITADEVHSSARD